MNFLKFEQDHFCLTGPLSHSNIPKHYAILSHTWGDPSEEVTHEDIKNRQIPNNHGLEKLKFCRDQAERDGYKHFWIDTCCIDKTNSAELSEAINSMFKWYLNSSVCYVYLSDVDESDDNGPTFVESRWFKRGWTLQELLAPDDVIFYDRNWKELGTKRSRADEIGAATGIPVYVLRRNAAWDFCFAQIVLWASGRETTRVEDRAYSLLGLLRINMPLIYGEGDLAFQRLQEEYMRKFRDHTILAWTTRSVQRRNGVLATSPNDFKDCPPNIERLSNDSEFSMTNRGIRINLPLKRLNDGRYIGVLQAKVFDRRLFVYLEENKETPGRFIRTRCDLLDKLGRNDDIPQAKDVCIDFEPKSLDPFNTTTWMQPRDQYCFKISFSGEGYLISGTYPLDEKAVFPGSNNPFLRLQSSGTYGGFLVQNTTTKERLVITLGVHNWCCWADIETEIHKNETWQDVVRCYYPTHNGMPSGGRRNARTWQCLDRLTRTLINGQTMRLSIRTRGETCRDNATKTYYVEISIN